MWPRDASRTLQAHFNNNCNHGTEKVNEEMDTSLQLARSQWTNRTGPSPRSQSFLSGTNTSRTRVKETAETPEITRSTGEDVETIVNSKSTDVRDLLIVSDENENDPLVDPTEVVTTNLVIETAEVKEERDIDPLRGYHHESRNIKLDAPLRLPSVRNKDTPIILFNARISRGATSVGVDISRTSARKDSNGMNLPLTRRVSQTGFRAVLGQTRGRLARRRSWGSGFFRSH